MKHEHTILYLFSAVSLVALTLWIIHDLWVVLLALFCLAGLHALLTRSKS